MASAHWPTYVLLSLYILAMAVVAIVANRKNKAQEEEDSQVVGHFLASKTFGPLLLMLTTFASVFSGYTVVGVPNESGKFGFTAIRWVGAGLFIAVSMIIVFPRLRRLSIVRKYESPGDFIRDRFGSQPLSVLITLCLCVPQLLYISVNILSLGALIESLTDGELSFYAVSVVSVFLILLFEAVGGLRSVAYTDAIQASVMVLVFIALPMVIGVKYGGFVGQVTNTSTCLNTGGCLNNVLGGIKGTTDVPQYYLRMPSSLTTTNFALFSLSLMSFALNPHIMQRAFTAKHDADIKFVTMILFAAPFITMVPGILIGITYLSNKGNFPSPFNTFPPFMSILGIFRNDSNGFVAFLSYVAMLAGISGIMSTADSALIGVSNTVSVNIFRNWLTPDFEQNKIVMIGKIVSFCTMAIGLGIAIHLYETGIQYGVMLTLQQAILWQAFPAYVFGLYTNVSHKPILMGVAVGILLDIILISLVFGNDGKTDPFAAMDPALAALDKSWSSFVGVLFNIIACSIGHWFAWGAEGKEEKTEGALSFDAVQEIMKNVEEPLTKYYGVFVWLSGICGVVSAFHWIAKPDPKLIAQYGEATVRALLYNGKVADVVGGFPKWAFATLIWYVIASIFGLYATTLWKVDQDEDRDHGTIVDEVSRTTKDGLADEDANKEAIALVSVTEPEEE